MNSLTQKLFGGGDAIGWSKKDDGYLSGYSPSPMTVGETIPPDTPVTRAMRDADQRWVNGCITGLWIVSILALLGLGAGIVLGIVGINNPTPAPTTMAPLPTPSPTAAPTPAPTPAPDLVVPGDLTVQGVIDGYHRNPGVGLDVSGSLLCLAQHSGVSNLGYSAYAAILVNPDTGLFASHQIQPMVGTYDNGRFKFTSGRNASAIAALTNNDYVNAHVFEHSFETGITTFYQIDFSPASDSSLWWDEPTGFYYFTSRGDDGAISFDHMYRVDNLATGATTDLTLAGGLTGGPEESKVGMIGLDDYFFVFALSTAPNRGILAYNRTSFDYVSGATRSLSYTYSGTTHPMFTYAAAQIRIIGVTYDPAPGRVYLLLAQAGPSGFRWLGYIQGTEPELASQLLGGNLDVTLVPYAMSRTCGDIQLAP